MSNTSWYIVTAKKNWPDEEKCTVNIRIKYRLRTSLRIKDRWQWKEPLPDFGLSSLMLGFPFCKKERQDTRYEMKPWKKENHRGWNSSEMPLTQAPNASHKYDFTSIHKIL